MLSSCIEKWLRQTKSCATCKEPARLQDVICLYVPTLTAVDTTEKVDQVLMPLLTLNFCQERLVTELREERLARSSLEAANQQLTIRVKELQTKISYLEESLSRKQDHPDATGLQPTSLQNPPFSPSPSMYSFSRSKPSDIVRNSPLFPPMSPLLTRLTDQTTPTKVQSAQFQMYSEQISSLQEARSIEVYDNFAVVADRTANGTDCLPIYESDTTKIESF